MHSIRNTRDVESIRPNSGLILSRKNLLQKVEEQTSRWMIFFIISSAVIMLSIIMSIAMEYTINMWISRAMIIGTATVCVIWWFWTLSFIIDITKNQKLIYQLLSEIYQEIEVVKSEIDPPDK